MVSTVLPPELIRTGPLSSTSPHILMTVRESEPCSMLLLGSGGSFFLVGAAGYELHGFDAILLASPE